jgi:hypothetical protein
MSCHLSGNEKKYDLYILGQVLSAISTYVTWDIPLHAYDGHRVRRMHRVRLHGRCKSGKPDFMHAM